MKSKSTPLSATSLIGMVIGGAIGLGVTALVMLFKLGMKAWPGHRQGVAAATASAPADAPAVVTLGRDYTDYEPSIPRCVQFPNVGYLTLWAYQGQQIVKRQLVISRAELAQKVGASRLPMPDMKWPRGTSLEVIESVAIEEAMALLKRKGGRSLSQATGELVAPTEAPSVAKSTAPRERKAAKPYVHMPQVDKQDTMTGVLKFAGAAPLTRGDRTIQHYAVDLAVPGVGVERIWGIDLQRALQDAKAGEGDTVEISRTGRSAVTLDSGKSGHKNHFHVRVL